MLTQDNGYCHVVSMHKGKLTDILLDPWDLLEEYTTKMGNEDYGIDSFLAFLETRGIYDPLLDTSEGELDDEGSVWPKQIWAMYYTVQLYDTYKKTGTIANDYLDTSSLRPSASFADMYKGVVETYSLEDLEWAGF